MTHARKTATVIAGNDRFTIDGETTAVIPRTTIREIHRYKLYAAGQQHLGRGKDQLTPICKDQGV